MGLAVRKHLQVRESERFHEPVRVGEEEVGFEFFRRSSAVSGDVAPFEARYGKTVRPGQGFGG